jgi:hypothetical protein
MPDAVTHPTPQELAAYRQGKLSAGAAAAVAAHLKACAACRQAAARPAASGTLLPGAAPTAPRPAAAPAAAPPRPVPPAPPPGLPPELANHPRFRIIRELGRGGMGVVYEAEQTLMERRVALKVINPSVLNNPDALARFHGEVKAAGKLDHKNIVRAYDAEAAGNLHLLVMEFVEGQSLAEVLQKKGPLPAAQACYYVYQAARGLQHAHEKGMVHRDIKPHNLMLTPDRQVKVLDFGLARLRSERGGGAGLTQADSFMGTPEYVAPEQATDARTADIKADIYSLGCTLYCLLTGRPPFQEDTPIKTILAHLDQVPRPLHELRPDVPPALSAVVAKMLAKKADERYQTPNEVAQALVPFVKSAGKSGVHGSATQAPGVGSPGRGTKIGGDTARTKGVVTAAAAPAAVPMAEVLPPFEDLTAASAPVKASPAAADAAPWWKHPGVLFGCGAGGGLVLLASAVGAWLLVAALGKPNPQPQGGAAVKPAATAHRPPPEQVVERPKEPEPPPPGFVALFDGKDLSGWKTYPNQANNWRVQDGVLVGEGPGGSVLFTERGDFENFVLRAEVRLNAGGDSGLIFRSRFGPGTIPEESYEAQIVNDPAPGVLPTGSIYVTSRRGASAVAASGPLPRPGEWFTYEITAQGYHFTLKVNGRVTLDWEDSRKIARTGHLAVQQLGDGTRAEFRRIDIKELPASPPEAPVVVTPPPENPRTYWAHAGGVYERVKGDVWFAHSGHFFRETKRTKAFVELTRTDPRTQEEVKIHLHANGAFRQVAGGPWAPLGIRGGHWALPPRPPDRGTTAGKGEHAREWVSLFNGRDLTGWRPFKGGNVEWSFEGGVLVGRSKPARPGFPAETCLLVTDRADYRNFRFRMETMLGAGGSFDQIVRAGPIRAGRGSCMGYWARVQGTRDEPRKAPTGSLFLGADLSEPLPLATAADAGLKPGLWFVQEVIVQGNHLRVFIDGKPVVDTIDPSDTFPVGRLALSCPSDSTVQFRKVEIKELPDDAVAEVMPSKPDGAPDPIGETLEKAKAAFQAQMAKLRTQVLEALDQAEAKARDRGDRKALDVIEEERAAFAKNGTPPRKVVAPATRAYQAERSAARRTLDAAYRATAAAYTKDHRDERADAVERERLRFEQDVPLDAFQPGTVWKGTTEVGVYNLRGSRESMRTIPATLTVLERDGSSYKARFEEGRTILEVRGTITRGIVRWSTKDVKVIQGAAGFDHTGRLDETSLTLGTERSLTGRRVEMTACKLHLEKK